MLLGFPSYPPPKEKPMHSTREAQSAIQRVEEILYLRGIRRPDALSKVIVETLLDENELYSSKHVEEQIKVHQEQYQNITKKYLQINTEYNKLLQKTELYLPFFEAVEFLLKEIDPLISQSQRSASTSLQEKANRAQRAYDIVEHLLNETGESNGQSRELIR